MSWRALQGIGGKWRARRAMCGGPEPLGRQVS